MNNNHPKRIINNGINQPKTKLERAESTNIPKNKVISNKRPVAPQPENNINTKVIKRMDNVVASNKTIPKSLEIKKEFEETKGWTNEERIKKFTRTRLERLASTNSSLLAKLKMLDANIENLKIVRNNKRTTNKLQSLNKPKVNTVVKQPVIKYDVSCSKPIKEMNFKSFINLADELGIKTKEKEDIKEVNTTQKISIEDIKKGMKMNLDILKIKNEIKMIKYESSIEKILSVKSIEKQKEMLVDICSKVDVLVNKEAKLLDLIHQPSFNQNHIMVPFKDQKPLKQIIQIAISVINNEHQFSQNLEYFKNEMGSNLNEDIISSLQSLTNLVAMLKSLDVYNTQFQNILSKF